MRKWVPVTGVLGKLRSRKMREQVRKGTPAKELASRFNTNATNIAQAMRA